jgi:exopolysaccharide biosynthesis polyprenyl glycosylphosphotransferase
VQPTAALPGTRTRAAANGLAHLLPRVGDSATGRGDETAGFVSPAEHSALTRVLDDRGWTTLRVTVDSLLLCAAVVLTLRWPGEPVPLSQGGALLVLPPMALVMMALCGAYERRLRVRLLDGAGTLVGAVSLSVMAIVVGETYLGPPPIAPGVLVHLWALSIVLVEGARTVVGCWRRWARGRGLVGRPTLIIGAGAVGAKIARRLQEDAQYGLRPIGFLDEDPAPLISLASDLPVLGAPDELAVVARATRARHVVLAYSATADRSFVPLLRQVKEAGVDVTLVPRMFEIMNDRVTFESVGGIPVLGVRATDPLGWRFLIKHAFDRVVAALLLVVLAPLLLALAMAVRLSSPGPVLFTQYRVGRDGQPFKLLKFRSMRGYTAEGSPFEPPDGCGPGGVEGVDRRTAVGCFIRRRSLDELPQLFNVLKGEMSLVGPRPERVEFVEAFRRNVERYGDRHRVRAGITGWAQVHGLRGQTSIADRAEWDNFYIENWSLTLDLRILAMTLIAVLRTGED